MTQPIVMGSRCVCCTLGVICDFCFSFIYLVAFFFLLCFVIRQYYVVLLLVNGG